jgi:hypothetical protein
LGRLLVDQRCLGKPRDLAHVELTGFDKVTGHEMVRLYFSELGRCIKTVICRQWAAGAKHTAFGWANWAGYFTFQNEPMAFPFNLRIRYGYRRDERLGIGM